MFTPFAPELRADPYPEYKRMRDEAPVWRDDLGNLFLSRYGDCVAVLRDHERFSSDSRTQIRDEDVEVTDQSGLFEFFGGKLMLFTDPPDHTRLRRLAGHAFTPRAVESWRPRVRSLVDELLAGVEPDVTFDVMETLARPLPVIVIAELLGVPVADRDRFAQWSEALGRTIDPDMNLSADDVNAATTAAMEFVGYFNDLIEQRRGTPGEDLLSALIAAEEEGDRLSHGELLANLILLLIAGHETTSNLLGNGALALTRFPDQRDRLSGEPALVRTAVDELLRYDPPVQFTARNALVDVDVAGTRLARGKQVIVIIGGANRDPAQFDAPDDVRLDRSDNRHLAFSHGIHFCIGAMLARMEAQEAFPALLAKCPKLEAAGEMSYRPNATLRGLARFDVRG
ncbi:MAG TPA: cytochrome P450 [Acidimicrobiales bacterium]|nr:cytochrome P450 [Acidimicrobiales bacterium]